MTILADQRGSILYNGYDASLRDTRLRTSLQDATRARWCWVWRIAWL